MNALEIKENRKKLGFTQEELAKMIGVSLKTISNYEKGEVIPATKIAILHNILTIPDINIVEEPNEEYKSLFDFDLLFEKNVEKLIEIEKIIQLSIMQKDIEKINHYRDIKKLLDTQNELLTIAKQSKKIDTDILKKL
jgi:transcriptional regulator with XRE-family HTH domain